MSGKHLNDISKVYLDTIANVKKAETNADIKRWEDLGGPTPGNYRADDNSAKLKEGRRLRKSDWRQDLKEVIDKPETEEKALKKVDEKKGIKNKVVINPSFKEAIEEIGGELLEVNAVDSVEKTQDDTQKKQEQHKKQVEAKQKKVAAMKKIVLQKKMQAVRGGAGGDITAGYEPEGEVVVEKDLSAAERRALPNKDFVFPGKGEGPEGKQRGAYPINDKKHARAALAMAAAHASPEKEAKVKAAVKKKYPDIEVSEATLMDKIKKWKGKKKPEKKATMDATTDKLHDWRQKNSPEQKEREKYVSPFRPIVKEADDKAYKYVVSQLKKKYGDGVLTKGDKMPEPSAAQKKKNAEIRAKRAKEDGRDATEKASDGRYSDRYSNRGSD